jgi:hypothetical protein
LIAGATAWDLTASVVSLAGLTAHPFAVTNPSITVNTNTRVIARCLFIITLFAVMTERKKQAACFDWFFGAVVARTRNLRHLTSYP